MFPLPRSTGGEGIRFPNPPNPRIIGGMSVAVTLPLTSAATVKRRDWASVVALTLACAIFAGLSAFLAVKSESDLEADATTHFLIARFALREHHYIVSVWGRPLCTLAYAFVAWIGTVEQGRLAARMSSLALALVVVAVTYLIGKRQGYRKPALVAIFLLAQPIFFLHSFSQLTEIPFAVVLMLAFLAFQRKRWLAMAVLTGLLPLGRPEGFGFILMAAAVLLVYRARWLWVLAVPFLIWNYAGWYITAGHAFHWWNRIFNREWYGWVFRNWPYAYRSMYGRGRLISFVGRLPILVSPLLFPFCMAGIVLGLRWIPWHGRLARVFQPRTWARRPCHELTHEQRCEIWIALIPLSILAVHSILWWQGLMGSNGELRYLVIVGPFFALMTARGWEWAWPKLGWTHPLLWAGVASLLPLTANCFYRVVPLGIYADGNVARQVSRWYQSNREIQKDFPRIMPTPSEIPFLMDLSQSDSDRMLPVCKMNVNHPPAGALLVWDPINGLYNSAEDMCVPKELIEKAGWLHYRHFQEEDRYCDVYLSPTTISGENSHLRYKGDWEGMSPELRLDLLKRFQN